MGNIEQFNLFGVALDQIEKEKISSKEEETVKVRNERRQFVRELLVAMEQLDSSNDPEEIGLVQDFSKPKRFFKFEDNDDYSESIFDAELTALKYEDSMKQQASIVLDLYSHQIKSLLNGVTELDEGQELQANQVANLVAYLSKVKIIDAPVLIKIINIHKC
mmetsp:Transcript_5516/g.9393  ORF Transcript_5516/g.9393 Transcript_5516/m.9393 type:complete len:162 (-) Transcript_5516:55-540(-)